MQWNSRNVKGWDFKLREMFPIDAFCVIKEIRKIRGGWRWLIFEWTSSEA